VTLMSLHNAKGLEFPFVFISGMEDGLFPLARAYEEPDQLEEERRLFYVGITRARQKLYLTHARTRRRAGEVLPCKPSSFLVPIPDELVEMRTTPAATARGGYGRWDRGFGGGSSYSPRRERQREVEDEPRGLVVEYDDPQEMPRFVKGEVVRHPQFGRGTIRELSGFGRDLKAAIEFQSVGRKTILLRYANLQKEL
jgi:DNA helicase II / ATP-dependent DNA helicase PcrA